MPAYRIAVLPGDGIGPEVMKEALKVLDAVAAASPAGISFDFAHAVVGGAAHDACGEHLPATTLDVVRTSDALLFGSVGGPPADAHLPKWKDAERTAILGLRKHFGFAINVRPSKVSPSLSYMSPLKASVIGTGVDIMIIRELMGGAYFGLHEMAADGRSARDEITYSWEQIEQCVRFACVASRARRRKVTVIDKANVLETSRLWRCVAKSLAGEYPDVTMEFMYVDNAAMQLVTNPTAFDVLVTENLFGDILSDEASVLPGSLGLMPSASLSTATPSLSSTGRSRILHMYEPIGGTAPDIAGRGIANPIAQILSGALLLRYSFAMEAEAAAVERAVDAVLSSGLRTGDLMPKGEDAVGPAAASLKRVGTVEMGDAIAAAVSHFLKSA